LYFCFNFQINFFLFGADASSLSNYIDPMDGTMMMSGSSGIGGGGNMLSGAGGLAGNAAGTSGSANGGLSEKMAISAIQKSLMQFCEKAVKSPPQYQTPMVSKNSRLLQSRSQTIYF